jgi:hypothetical protein
MEKTKRLGFLRNLLILASLIGLVLMSWLLGHALRNSTPALWHPAVFGAEPQILIQVEIESAGIRRVVILPGFAPGNAPTRVQFQEVLVAPPAECLGTTYFTSLPAKCRTADGRLVKVPGLGSNVILIPLDK